MGKLKAEVVPSMPKKGAFKGWKPVGVASNMWLEGPRKGGGHANVTFYSGKKKKEPHFNEVGEKVTPTWDYDEDARSTGSGVSRLLCCIIPPNRPEKLTKSPRATNRGKETRGMALGLGEGLMSGAAEEVPSADYVPHNESSVSEYAADAEPTSGYL